MNKPDYPYALVVRWPVGGIRTHLKYAREMLNAESPRFSPLYVSYDDADTRLALNSLNIPAAADYSAGVHSLLGMMRRLFRVCFTNRIKVIHSQGFISSIISTPASLLLHKRHIVSVHDVITDKVIDETSLFSRLILGMCLRVSFAVHAVGRDCANSIRRLPFMKTAKNIITIRNGIDPQRFSNPQPADLRGLFKTGSDTRIIGFFGRFHPQKGFRYLVDAVELLKRSHPELPIKVIAVGDAGTLKEDKEYIEAKGVKESFFFHSQVENPASLMVACDMIAMPSLWEAYSLLAAEVLTLGVPLLASDCIGLAEVVENTPARSFPAENAAALAQAIYAEALHPSKTAAVEFSQQARIRFDFRENAHRLNRLLYIAQTGGYLQDLR